MRIKLILAVIGAAFLPATAHAQNLNLGDQQVVQRALQESGYLTESFSSNEGTPRIVVTRRGEPAAIPPFTIDIVEGIDGGDGHILEFSSPTPLYDVMPFRAAWNRAHRYPAGDARHSDEAAQEGVSLALEMSVLVPPEGISRAAFEKQLRTWRTIVDAYRQMIAGRSR